MPLLNVNPQRADLANKISDILTGNAKRGDVSEWAIGILIDDSSKLEDLVILKYLKLLGAVDLPSSDRDFLYTDNDLRHWMAEIENQ